MSDDGWLYLDDQGQPQGPYPQASILGWLQAGFFDAERKAVAASAADDGAPVPQNEYEAYLNEYYRNHYEQLYIQLAAEYEASLKAYEEARAKADAAQANQPPPDDGYQVPQVDFKEYGVKGTFDKVKGRMVSKDRVDYFGQRGMERDSEGRQLDSYYDTKAFQDASFAGEVVKNDADKSRKKPKTDSAVPKWMEEDPLEGAFQKE